MSGEVQYPSNWSPYALKNFAGGLNVGDAETQGNQLREAMNVELPTKNGAIQNRKGYRNMLVNDVVGIPTPVIDGSLEVTTQQPTSVAETTATGNGTIVNLGMSNPTAHGMAYKEIGVSKGDEYTFELPYNFEPASMVVDGDYLYGVAKNSNSPSNTFCFYILDISDPTNIITLNTTTGTTSDYYGSVSETSAQIIKVGDYLYIGSSGFTPSFFSWSGFHIINVTDPTTPVKVSSMNLHDRTDLQDPWIRFGVKAFALDGNYLYINGWRAFGAFDVTIPSAPVFLSSIQIEYLDSGGIIAEGNYVYTYRGYSVSSYFDFYVIDVTNKLAMTTSSVKPADNLNGNMVKYGDYVFVNSQVDSQLLIIDVSTPSSPSIENYISVTGYNLYLDDTTLYVFGYSGGYRCFIYDIADPLNPIAIGNFYLDSAIYIDDEIKVKDGYLIAGRENSSDVKSYEILIEAPTILDNTTDEGATSTTGAFTSELTGLTASTIYSARTYATNVFSTTYGETKYFTTEASE